MHKYLQSVARSIIQSADEPLKPLRYLRNDCVGSVCNCVTTRNRCGSSTLVQLDAWSICTITACYAASNFLPIVCKDHLSSIIPSDHQCTISACQEALVSVLEFEKFGTQHSPCVQAVCLSSNPFLGWGSLGSLSVVETWLLDRPKKFSYSHHGFLG